MSLHFNLIKDGAFLGIFLMLLVGCSQDETYGPQSSFSGFVAPVHFPEPIYDNPKNPVTYDGFQLGRKLFYDKNLSADGSVSCGSCHAQTHAFADHNTSLSRGIYGRLGKRNSPPIFNLAWNNSFMWDGGINHIETMPVAPLTDTLEMGMEINTILDYLRKDPNYPLLFEKAFGFGVITDQKMLFAMAQFMSAMISDDAKYDHYIQGKLKLNDSERNGLLLFREYCASCHSEPLFTNFEFLNNGFGSLEDHDPGRARITQNEKDIGKFRVPSLRNIALTYPYMHNGEIRTLEDVLDHYASPIGDSPNVDPRLSGGVPLSEDDKSNIVLFLHTLTDYKFISNPIFSDPN